MSGPWFVLVETKVADQDLVAIKVLESPFLALHPISDEAEVQALRFQVCSCQTSDLIIQSPRKIDIIYYPENGTK